MVTVGDLTDHGGQHVPLLAHGEEGVDILRGDDGAHAFLRLAGEHLGRGHALGTHRHLLQLDVHAAVPPAAASSLVAQDNPAPPRSWMPTTSPAW